MFRFGIVWAGWLVVASPARAADPSSLQISIEEGDGQTYALGSRATRGITVAITDEAGKAVEGATVTFALPDSGPSGFFSNGSKTQILTTRADGRVSVWGMRWNRQPGTVDVRITVGKGQARGGTVCSQRLAESPGPSVSAGGGFSHKWLWIGLAAAGAASAGAVAAASKGGSSTGSCSGTVLLPSNPCSSTPTSTGVTVIGQPTINLGHP